MHAMIFVEGKAIHISSQDKDAAGDLLTALARTMKRELHLTTAPILTFRPADGAIFYYGKPIGLLYEQGYDNRMKGLGE